MLLKNTPERYGAVTKFFHWTIALLILALLCIGIYMADYAPKDASLLQLFALHKSTGLLVFALAFCRICWHLYTRPAEFTVTIKPWEKILARITHGALYFCMLAMPLTGWVFSTIKRGGVPFFGLFTLPQPFDQQDPATKWWGGMAADLHGIIGYTLIGIIALHAAGALKHFIIDKDLTLQRMLPFGTAKQDQGKE